MFLAYCDEIHLRVRKLVQDLGGELRSHQVLALMEVMTEELINLRTRVAELENNGSVDPGK